MGKQIMYVEKPTGGPQKLPATVGFDYGTDGSVVKRPSNAGRLSKANPAR